ncbi:tyrosine-type recombinase/integrase [Paenibacillus terrigena]|uniref:tyrosine-type recombinase/integrase n=1 Tax=Paenibacillus terrigena TaxID=369333 RepID=UPI0028D4F89C|nr:tyrosine-type recombinase/integrase [Paenibacillus terrigena]
MHIERGQRFNFRNKKEKPIRLKLDQLIDEYLYVKRSEKRSPKTVSAYEQTLSQFAKWLESANYESITVETIREYIYFLSYKKSRWDDHPTSPTKEIGLSARTVNNNIRNLKVFFNYLLRERIIKCSPMELINYQREEKNSFSIFTDEDVKLLLSVPDKRTYTGHRDYVIMLLLCDCGLRINELTNLKVNDVDFESNYLNVGARSNKIKTRRIVPMSSNTANSLKNLILRMAIEPTDYIFLTQYGERYSGDSFGKMLKKYANRVGLAGPRVSPHTFRHYMAVKFLREGGNTIVLMRILGHSSLSMTEKYVRFSMNDIREQHDKASPVKNLIDLKKRKDGKRRFY